MKYKTLHQLKHERAHYKSIYRNAKPQGQKVLLLHLRKLNNRIKTFRLKASPRTEDIHVVAANRVGALK